MAKYFLSDLLEICGFRFFYSIRPTATKYTRKKSCRRNRSEDTKRVFPSSYRRYELIENKQRSGYDDFKIKIFKIKKLRRKIK
ncbi:MAG: hypothetical protein [Bacteriophage sp.]|nr:MAG: hypothetical protein [Bacteriophage sp.]